MISPDEDPDVYRTVERTPLEHEPAKTKGSRHIANVFRVTNTGEINDALSAIRARMPDASHHAWAWRLAGQDGFRYSDDGEPSGSAGRPILQQIDGRQLIEVLVTVSRYFGGTKLGVGGLVRAYGGAASEALDLAGTHIVIPHTRVRIAHAYEDSGSVAGVLARWQLAPVNQDYTDSVVVDVAVRSTRVDDFVTAIRDATANRAMAAPHP